MTCLRCWHTKVKKFGTYGRKRIQRYRCADCKATFSDRQPRPLGTHIISVERATQIISLMLEGMSVRAISRLTGAEKKTILSLLLTIGRKCATLFDSRVRGIRPRYLELDETWAFVHTKEKHLGLDDPNEWGDTYTWIALDAETKLVVSYLVGKRDAASAFTFVRDLSERVVGRCQVTSDGFRSYIPAIEEYFGADVDFAQLVKIMGRADNAGPGWYGPATVIETIPTPITGDPDPEHISTSYVERSNLSVRMHLRRFTRLTNAHSKSLTHLEAAVAIYMSWYNLCRVHQTLRVTPAMQAGLADHVWEMEELLTWKS